MSIFVLAGLGADLSITSASALGVLEQVTAQQIGRLVHDRAKAVALEARLDRIEPDGRDRHARDQENGARLRERRRAGLELTDDTRSSAYLFSMRSPQYCGVLMSPAGRSGAGGEGGDRGRGRSG